VYKFALHWRVKKKKHLGGVRPPLLQSSVAPLVAKQHRCNNARCKTLPQCELQRRNISSCNVAVPRATAPSLSSSIAVVAP